MTPALESKDLLIRTLTTPNPNALKFVINASFKDEGKATFSEAAEGADLPLVRDLFAIVGVTQVHLFQNTLTVTYSGDVDGDGLSDKVGAVIRTRYAVHDPTFAGPTPVVKSRSESNDPVVQSIERILDRTIRPGLQADGGDIEIISLIDNELKIVYQGACGGCPSSMAGTLEAIQGILREELENPAITVMPVEVYSSTNP